MNLTQRAIHVREKLESFSQVQVLRFWDKLTDHSKEKLLDQIESIDFQLIDQLNQLLSKGGKSNFLEMTPAPVIAVPVNAQQQARAKEAIKTGEAAIAAGKVCAFLVSGGQGTRLGYDGPKGCFPIGPVSHKSIFQMHAEKILAAQRRYNTEIPWYIMTSETNNEATCQFFMKHQYFGMNASNVMFFPQRMIPVLGAQGKMILDAKDHIFVSPNGHGGALLALVESGALDDMVRRGIEAISYFQVDNVLIRIIDPLFIGYHIKARSQMSSKMLRKRGPYEKLGHFGLVDDKLHVIEYSDMREDDKLARNPDGSLKYNAGSPAIHLIDPDFVRQETQGGLKLPYHIAHKKIPCLDDSGKQVIPEIPNGYKFETFIFDALRDAERFIIMEAIREHEFSPVKNKDGEDSPDTARRDLTRYFGEWLEAVGISVPRDTSGMYSGTIEIGPLYADTKEMFIEKAKVEEFTGSFYRDAELDG
jgi:UDP-N-acetylglucosamine/UDP-N-acetylgalactosamine diphosphorylase